MAGRLGGKGRKLDDVLADFNLPPLNRHMSRLAVWQLGSMHEAVECHKRRLSRYWPERGERRELIEPAGDRALAGDPQRLAAAVSESDGLVEAAIAADARLARRSEWRRGEEGEFVCPALLSQGDDSPCFFRRRQVEAMPNGSNPIRVVLSTDDNKVPPGTAAAFIATVRLVQQWRPVEIWWQGAWLGDHDRGFVFHVPLISGDVDFGRLEFCIADQLRDNFSWGVMIVHACEKIHATWNGCSMRGSRSYLPDTHHFISHHGIAPSGESIAAHAAEWLEWGALYDKAAPSVEASALQTIAPETTAAAAAASRIPRVQVIDRTF